MFTFVTLDNKNKQDHDTNIHKHPLHTFSFGSYPVDSNVLQSTNCSLVPPDMDKGKNLRLFLQCL